ncbi:MAG: hypothetical protein NVSMB1_09330 [Polyangiales bacterium]
MNAREGKKANEETRFPDHEVHVDLRAEGVTVGVRQPSLLVALAHYAPVAYVSAIVVRDSPLGAAFRIAAVGAALVITSIGSKLSGDLPAFARGAARLAIISLVVTTLLSATLPLPILGPIGEAFTVLFSVVGAAASLRCVVAIGGLGGLGRLGAIRTQSLARMALVLSVLWILAGAFEAGRVLLLAHGRAQTSMSSLDALAVRSERLVVYAMIVAGTATFLLMARRLRRLELGAHERHDVLLGGAAIAFPFAIVAICALDPIACEARGAMLLSVSALCLTVGALTAQLVKDPARARSAIAHGFIGMISLAVVWGSMSFTVGRGVQTHAPLSIALGVIIGLSTPAIARWIGLADVRFAPLRGAVSAARDAMNGVDTREMHRGVLSALRVMSGHRWRMVGVGAGVLAGDVVRPRLYTFTPLQEVTLEASGEVLVREPTDRTSPKDCVAAERFNKEVPSALLDLIAQEPLGVIRVEVLLALEVRRPDLRLILKWCDDRGAAAVVGLMGDCNLIGLLVVPRGPHLRSVGLLEVRALRTIASLVTARLSLETSLARSASRAQVAEQRARDAEHGCERQNDRAQRLTRALRATARPFANKISVGGYAPRAMALRLELDALATSSAHLVILHRPGTDPTPYAARIHEKSSCAGAFQVIDAVRADASDAAVWNHPIASPLEGARNGTLLVRNATRLAAGAQRALLRAIAFHTSPASDPAPLEVRIVMAISATDVSAEPAFDGLDPALLGHLRLPPLRIPPLRERAEDLRAIVLDRLAALGMASSGEPFGIADDAMVCLLEQTWPGDDDALDAVLVAASTLITHRRLERRHLEGVFDFAPTGNSNSS